MAIDDPTPEQEVVAALFFAYEALTDPALSEDRRVEVLRVIRQAINRIREATAQ